MNKPHTTFLLDRYRFSWSEEDIDVIVDRLHEEKAGLQCEISISTAAMPSPGLLREGRFNLSAPTTRSQWERSLNDRMPDVDWYGVLEQICTLSIRRWREGEPLIDLGEVESSPDLPYLLSPFVIEGGATVLFADGGSGKSLFALALALTIATGTEIIPDVRPLRMGPVLYLDWEWDPDSHAERMAALCAGVGMAVPKGMIFYRREVTSVIESAAMIRQHIAAVGAVAVVTDSLGMARGGEPESADLTIRTFGAFRTFGVPVIAIDHVAKHATDKSQSFGSVYTKNAARLMWRMDSVKDDGTNDLALNLVNTKANRKTQQSRGYRVVMEEDDFERLTLVRFDAADIRAIPGMAIKLGIREQVASVLMKGALTDEEIVAALANDGITTTEVNVRMAISRNKEMFTTIFGEDRKARRGLLSRALAHS